MVRASLVVAALTLIVGAACQAEIPKRATPTVTAPSLVSPSAAASARPQAMGPDDAIRAVFDSPGVKGSGIFAPFPTSVGPQSCDIHGGGPFPGIVIPGTCRTDVETDGSAYVVKFTEVWDAARFHAQIDPSAGQLHATWTFTVSLSGVVFQSLSGNFPPQMVK